MWWSVRLYQRTICTTSCFMTATKKTVILNHEYTHFDSISYKNRATHLRTSQISKISSQLLLIQEHDTWLSYIFLLPWCIANVKLAFDDDWKVEHLDGKICLLRFKWSNFLFERQIHSFVVYIVWMWICVCVCVWSLAFILYSPLIVICNSLLQTICQYVTVHTNWNYLRVLCACDTRRH